MEDVRAIVLDEADEMLKMGFREELELILGSAPEDHRSLMFSATVSKSIARLTETYQSNALRINTVSEAPQHVDISYRALLVNKNDQENAIINVLQYYDAKNAIVFGDTRVAVNRMTRRFTNRGFAVVTLSGEFSQKERSSAIQSLRDGRARVCVATDVAARGLDLPDLELVIHAAIPKNREALLHRSGRTGRAGRKGVSALIVPHNGRRRTERLLRDAKVTAEWGPPPSAADVLAKDNERLLSSLVLEDEVSDAERDMVVQLLKASSPETIATLFLRNFRASRAAPEELLGVPTYDPDSSGRENKRDRGERKSRSRNDFENGVWYALNLGRKQKAEPRWILPMLCKSGGLAKRDIGVIKISETRTFIEISNDGAVRFQEAIGVDGKIEKAITASRLDGPPDFSAAENKPEFKPRDKSKYPNKKRARGNDRHGDKPKGKDWDSDRPRKKSKGNDWDSEKPKKKSKGKDWDSEKPKKKSKGKDSKGKEWNSDKPKTKSKGKPPAKGRLKRKKRRD